MPHYKDELGSLYWLDSSAFAYMLPPGCVEISEGEAESLSRNIQDLMSAVTPEQKAKNAQARRDELLTIAALRIAPIQDSVDIGKSDETVVARLIKWKQYRIALGAVESQIGFPDSIDWPVEPD